jgi:hypothetical protein
VASKRRGEQGGQLPESLASLRGQQFIASYRERKQRVERERERIELERRE